LAVAKEGAVTAIRAAEARWLVPLRVGAAAARSRLVCCPYAGGSATLFRRWCELLPADIEVWGVEYPGHGGRIGEPLLSSVEGLAQGLAPALAAADSLPYVLFGHSMGSLVAFETCHVLRDGRARPPALLIVAGHRAPHLPASSPPLHDAPHDDFVKHLRELGATPPQTFESADLLDLLLPILRSDFCACETYAPPRRPPLPIRMAAYGGLADDEAGPAELAAWQAATSAECTVRMFRGDHFFLNDAASQVTATLAHDIVAAVAADRPAHSDNGQTDRGSGRGEP
jgi:medium-chain acyl-[acyl-carrier-protein] hydrolase